MSSKPKKQTTTKTSVSTKSPPKPAGSAQSKQVKKSGADAKKSVKASSQSK